MHKVNKKVSILMLSHVKSKIEPLLYNEYPIYNNLAVNASVKKTFNHTNTPPRPIS